MRILITLCLSLLASMQMAQAESIKVGNNSEVDFSSLSTDARGTEVSVENQVITGMILGNITFLISDIKWTDTEMADYQQRYGSNPHQLVIAAFDNASTSDSVATTGETSTLSSSTSEEEAQSTSSQTTADAVDESKVSSHSEVESASSPVDDKPTESSSPKEQKEKTPKELAEIFSTRDGSTLLYLYVSEFESVEVMQNIALFFSEDAQDWFTEQGLIAIPDAVQQQNLVTLGLKEPQFKGGYR